MLDAFDLGREGVVVGVRGVRVRKVGGGGGFMGWKGVSKK